MTAISPATNPLFIVKFALCSFALLGLSLFANASKAAECGRASHYGIGDGYHGLRTASGQRFNAYGLTAAHPTLPMGTKVRVKNRDNGKAVVVTINDRGPYIHGRILDLSFGSFSKIASPSQGVANICIS